jgi:hypothetical protein
MVQHGADGSSSRRRSVALISAASETWGCYTDAEELARRARHPSFQPVTTSRGFRSPMFQWLTLSWRFPCGSRDAC